MTLVDAALIERVGEELAAAGPVRHLLEGGGVLHIDRRLPFIAVYRHPPDRPDPGTHQLLLGEAAFVHFPPSGTGHEAVTGLLREIAEWQIRPFGAFLVLELWATSADRPYCVVAPRHGTPDVVLEELENSLLGLSAGRPDGVPTIDYRDRWAPPGLEPLAMEDTSDGAVCHLGLGVPDRGARVAQGPRSTATAAARPGRSLRAGPARSAEDGRDRVRPHREV